jgi:type IV secretion system protein TrbJ
MPVLLQRLAPENPLSSALAGVVLVLMAALPLSSPGTGIPVIDFSNLTQNVITALKQVSACAQQVQQYRLQLQQYANQVKNTVAPVAQVAKKHRHQRRISRYT